MIFFKIKNTGSAKVAAIKAKTDVLENADLTGLALSSEISALNNVSVSDVVSGMQLVADDFKADVSGLSTFNPSVDTVARVTLVDTVTTNTDMRGTDNANTVEPDNSSIAAIKTKTDNLPPDTQSEINSIKKNTNLIPAVF